MVGVTVSHYRITGRLGAGGMGEIFKAQDTRLNRTVAIKVLAAAPADADERRRRFLQEAQAASALNHPNIITIHDIVSEGENDFMVMELVAGKTLAELVPQGGLPLPLVLAYGVQMAGALEAAHGAGIVHRDLKPGNVMVTDAGLVKILDFGLAKLTWSASDAQLGDETRTLAGAPLTIQGSIMGTVSYMSPEQAEGKPVDARSDIFAFGAILHEMVTGERAFGGDSAISALTSILRDDVRPLTQVAGVPAALAAIVDRCLRKNREERWQSIEDVRAALAALKRDSDSGVLFVPPPAPPAVRGKRRLTLAATALGAVSLAIAAGWWFIGRPLKPAPGQPAAAAPVPPPKFPDEGVLTNDGVLEMVRAHVAPKLIMEQIASSTTRFDVSTSEIVRLTRANVPAEVLEAMRNPKGTAAAPVVASPARRVDVPDGLPVGVRLAEDVPADAPVGTPLRFVVESDFRQGGALVLAKGAAVSGEIVVAARKKLIGGNRILFRLKDAAIVGGGRLALRATPLEHGEDSRRPLDIPGTAKRPKDVAAVAGAEYVAYVAGSQTVVPRK